jgi:hypothetical protein
MLRIRRCLALVAAAGLCLCAACDGGTARRPETGATLDGTVSYGDQKVRVGLVIVQGTSAVNGFVDDDGHYHLDNVPLGDVHLAVNTEAGKGQLKSRMMAQTKGKAKALPNVIDVPAKYQDPQKSDITTNIKPGANTYNIVIPK